ncbi:SET domain-containing protein 5 [Tolypocladium ophioglossoides CBS 100239]|uniref:SET domain-containing protein 5 n=1 Tax=Tolypocladium ophioglossoides (strain CBS 100239) TaxID=1163406 RepID=A0A0L0NF81_TOLOC|nr:SET domain-containing protein 5 [Tolypocladium ophioglossoides CBS 100239]
MLTWSFTLKTACAVEKMSLLALLLVSALAAASGQHIRDVCSSSPLRQLECRRPGLDAWDSLAQTPLGASHSAPPPWTFQGSCVTPENVTESYCVYSSRGFADGRGISILTTPERAEIIRRLPAFVEAGALSRVNTDASPPYEERELPGRGRGLIANKTLHRGDQIFAHTPILIVDEEAWQDAETKQWIEMQKAAVNGLPPASKEQFWELFGQPGEDPVSSRVDTNAFSIDINETTHSAVLPEIARLNHDCRPNAGYFFDPQTLTHYVHAVTDISPGTEITITYIDPHMPRRHRLARLSQTWGFNCSCSLCSMHPSLTQASDARLHQMHALEERLQDWETASPEIALAFVSLYEQERLYASISDAYRFAALTFCAEGQRWSAIKYARLAIEIGMLNDGFLDEDVKQMMKLAKEPEKESCWLKRVM